MQVSVKRLPKSTVEMVVEVTPGELQSFRAEAVVDISKHVKMDGFRAGHIPEEKLVEKVGEEVIQREMIDRAVKKFYVDAVTQEKVQIVAPPEIEVTSVDPLKFTAKIVTLPELILGDYNQISLVREDAKVTDREFDNFIGELRKRHAIGKSVTDRAARMGDQVEIDFAGSTPDGVPLDNTSSKNHPLRLGSNSFVPGFEEGVVGMKIGEKKEITVRFPKEYHAKHLAGKDVKFKIELHKLEELEEPKLGDDFAAKVKAPGAKWVDVEKDIREYLASQKKRAAQSKLEDSLMQELLKIARVEIPEVLIKEEVEFMLTDLKNRLTQGGMDFAKYLEKTKKTEAEIRKEMMIEAEKRVKIRLIVNRLLDKEKPEVTDEEFRAEVQALAHRGKPEDHDRILREYDALSSTGQRLKHQMKVIKLLQSLTKILTK